MALGCSIAYNLWKKKNSKISILQELDLFFHNFAPLCLKLVKIKKICLAFRRKSSNTHTCVYTHIYRQTHTYIYTHSYLKKLPCFQKEIIKHTHIYIHIYTDRHKYTSTHIHTYINSLPFQVQKYQTNPRLKWNLHITLVRNRNYSELFLLHCITETSMFVH